MKVFKVTYTDGKSEELKVSNNSTIWTEGNNYVIGNKRTTYLEHNKFDIKCITPLNG